MGKLLNLGTKLNYPITITKFHKQVGEKISKDSKILEFKWTWQNEVGDFVNQNTWKEDQISFGDWDSSIDGTIKSWKVKVGQVIHKDMKFVEVEEDCPHSVQFQGLCGMCGKDMTEVGFASVTDDTTRAQISMIHDQTSLKVSTDEASKAEEELQRRLLKHRKLSLVVDLDQTIIQACVEPTIGEWQNDTNNPNHDAVKEVRKFQLEEGPRGIAQGMWYYVKLRPGLTQFLDKISQTYELHVYTMGTRAYARNIARIVDPDKKLFGDRIISRDESGSMTSKHLGRLFPVDTKMVVIIDDRSDVWPANRNNLIKVVAYDFFTGVGDINASFLPKSQEVPKPMPTLKNKTPEPELLPKTQDDMAENPTGETNEPTDEASPPSKGDATDPPSIEISPPPPSLAVVSAPSGNEEILRQEQTAEQEKTLEEQLTSRPLLHLQEKLDQEDDKVEPSVEGNDGTHQPQHRHSVLRDEDAELYYLQNHLELLHKTFFDEYDATIRSVSGGRVAQLKPGATRKLPIKEARADLAVVPDVAVVMPRLKEKVFEGCVIVTSGIIPLNIDIKRSELGLQVKSFGADLKKRVSKRITHLVTSSSRARTSKVKEAAQYGTIKIVNQQWLTDSMSKWQKQNEDDYLVEIHEADRRRPDGSNPDISILGDDSFDESPSGTDSDEEKENGNHIPGSQTDEDFTDEEGLIPDDLEPGQSPIEDLADMDWGDMGDELKDLLGSDSEDSDTSSIASDSSRTSENGKKRRRADTTDEDDSDDGSKLSKKQRTSSERGKAPSRLKESSLPTPGVTGDEKGTEEVDGDSDAGSFDDQLEADLLAEFDKQDEEEQDANGTGETAQ